MCVPRYVELTHCCVTEDTQSPHGSTRHEVHLALGVLTIGREPSQNRGLNTYRL